MSESRNDLVHSARVFYLRVYIWEAVRIIRLTPSGDKWRHKILYELLAVIVAIIVIDWQCSSITGYYFSHLILESDSA